MILAPVLVFFLLLAAAALWAERRGALGRSANFGLDYFLGGRSLGGVVLAMTLTATYGSVSSFVSGPGLAWTYGLGWVVFAAPQIIAGFLVLGILGRKAALVSRAVGAVTVIDLLRARYRSRTLATLAALSLLVFFTTMMTGQFVGGAAIFAEAAGVERTTGLLLFGALTVFYTAFGGFRAVALTDAVCALLMVTGMGVLAASILGEVGGLANAFARAAEASPDPAAFLSPDAGGALPWSLLFSAWVLVGFGTAGLPQSIVRCMSYRRGSDLSRAIWVTTLVTGALMIGMTTIGVLARAVMPGPFPSTDHMIPRLIATHMSPLAAGITLIGPLAATMSTVSSLLISASSAVVKDLLLDVRPALARDDRRLAFLSRGTTLVLGLLALVLALDPASIVVWINLAGFGGLELTFLLPLALGLFWRRANGTGALASILGGIALYAALLLLKPDLGGWHAVVPAQLFALVLFVGVSLAGRPEADERLELFFPRRSQSLDRG